MSTQLRASAVTPASGPEAFTDAVLEILGSATWPDGSALVDVDATVLRDRLAPQILAAAHLLAATATITTGGAR